MLKKLNVILIICLLSLASSVPSGQAQTSTIIIETLDSSNFPIINATISVVNAGNAPIQELKPEDFEIVEAGQILNTVTVDIDTPSDEPIAVALILDLSGSAPLEEVQRAAKQFLDSLNPNDRVAIIGFNTPLNPDPNNFDPFKEANFTNAKGLISEIIDGFETHPESAVYEAILKGVSITANEKTSRKAILVMSDGHDIHSRPEIASADDPERLARQEHIPIFTVGIANPTADLEANLDYLSALANKTGGRYEAASSLDDMGSLFQKVGDQLRKQYQLEFQVQGLPDGKPHALTIQVQNPEGQGVIEELVTFNYPTPPEIPEVIGLQRDVNGELQDLAELVQLRGNVLIVPKIIARNPIVRVEYSLNGERVETIDTQSVTNARYQPWEWLWDTGRYAEGGYQLQIIARDDADHVSQAFMLPLEIDHLTVIDTPTPLATPTEAATPISPSTSAPEPTTSPETVGFSFLSPPVIIIVIAIIIIILIIIATVLYVWWQRSRTVSPSIVTTSEPDLEYVDSPTQENWQPIENLPPTHNSGIPDFSKPGTPLKNMSNAPTQLDSGVDQYGLSSAEKTELLFATNQLPITGLLIVQEDVGNLKMGQTFPLTERETTVGRMEDNLIMLPDSSVSRHHSKITLEGVVFRIHDLKSANGTKVNGDKIDTKVLAENDRIQLGRIKMKFVILDRSEEK